MWYFWALGGLIIVIILTASIIMTEKISKIKHDNYEKRIYVETNNGCLQMDWYDKRAKDSFFLTSDYGYQIYGEYFKNETETNKTVVIMHGFGANLIVSLKYAKMFLELGFNAVIFDNTNCGRSGGKFSTMGKREVADLSIVVEKARALTGDNAVIGLHGESLGAASSIVYLERDKDIAFLISDCAFSDLFDELAYTAKRKFYVPKFPVLYISALICKLKYGYNIFKFSPVKTMIENDGFRDIPMMFIHGTDDRTTPCEMVDQLYDAKKGERYLYKVQYAIHARSFLYDKERYKKEVKNFLMRVKL